MFGKAAFDSEIRTPQQLMGVPIAARRFMEGFLLEVRFMAAVPGVQLRRPVKPVIWGFDAEQHQHQGPKFRAGGMPWKPCQP